MTDTPTPAATPTAAPATAVAVPEDAPSALDAHGFNSADYDWVPVRRQPHPGGWSGEKQRAFITALADTGSVTEAARSVCMSTRSAYALRRAPEGAGFARAWSAAVRRGMNRLVDVCLERATDGSEEPVFDKDGRVLYHRRRYHDRMAMFLLRAHMPELFRDAHRADRARGEALPPAPEPVADAIRAIDPVPPAAPHALMPPDELATALQVADLMGGELPHWRRDPGLARRADVGPGAEPAASPLGEQFERDLEAAKNGSWRPPAGARARRKRR